MSHWIRRDLVSLSPVSNGEFHKKCGFRPLVTKVEIRQVSGAAVNNKTTPESVLFLNRNAEFFETLSRSLALSNYELSPVSHTKFLATAVRTTRPAAVLIDLDAFGLQPVTEVAVTWGTLPTLILFDRCDFAMAVAVIRNGAYDLVDKALRHDAIAARIDRAVRACTESAAQTQPAWSRPAEPMRHERLTSRELEILGQIAKGASNKVVARTLDISPRTVEVHRSKIMHKLGAKNAIDLINIVRGVSLVDREGRAVASD